MKKINKKNLFQNFIIIFLAIQPVFDLKIFYNSISTLIRTLVIILLFGIYCSKDSKKRKIIMLIYVFVAIIFLILHHLNAMKFKSMVPGNFNYSCIKEILYFVKMIVPILLIYVIKKSEISSNKVTYVIQLLVFIMSSNIIITNIMGISYGSYSDEIIKSNFLGWFNNKEYTYKDLSSKGTFEFANQIGAVLLMFLPFTIYSMLNQKKIKNLILLFMNVFALILLGTRVAVLGIAVVFIYTIATILFMKILQKKESIEIKKILLIAPYIILYIIVLPVNPMFNRIEEMNNQQYDTIQVSNSNNIVEVIDNEVKTSNFENEKEKQIKYIKENYKTKKINEKFIMESYPYQYDTEFWINILNLDIYKTTNYRYLEKQMIKRVVEINNNKYDKLFGITYTRIQNIFNIEQDFVVQYYSVGILGCVLIFSPYLILLCMFIYNVIKSKFLECSIDNMLSFITIIMMFIISYNSGNLLNSLSFTIYFAILFYKLYNIENFETKDSNNNLSSIGGKYVYKKCMFKFEEI